MYIDRVVVCLFSFYFRSVVWASFHLRDRIVELAKTEKRIAEKERRDEKNSENLSNLIAKLQQST